MFIHLTTHSAYSLQEGVPLPGEIARFAQAQGMPAVALTDHRLLTGSIEFVLACKQVGVQPILGLEIDLEHGKLALLATNLNGWSNLCRLSSVLALQEDPFSTCSLDKLALFSDDLLALSDDQGDPTGERLGQIKSLFPDRLYMSFYQPAHAVKLSSMARKMGLPTVVTHPVYTLTAAQAPLQRTLSAIRLNQTLASLPPSVPAPAGAYFTSASEMDALYPNFPGALAASAEIAQRCKFDMPFGVTRMPTVPLPPGQTAAQTLCQKAVQGARRLYGEISPQVQSRLDHELGVIANMGFEPIFLIVEEILNFARQTNVPYSSRGSAASSLVAHCLGITGPDPLEHNLYFERFLNPARTTPPDIDTDLCSRRRDGIIQHVFDTYGADRVAMVGTINRFRARSALADVAKAHALPAARIREMANQLPSAFFSRIQEGEPGSEPISPFKDLRLIYPSPQDQQVFDQAEALLKLPRHLSVHAGGLIVAPGLLTDLVPVMRSGSKGVIITQLDLEHVEALGLVKIDLLGIRGLTVLGDVAEFVVRSQPESYTAPLAVLDSTPSQDVKTSNRIEKGQTIGCFQIESPGMRSTLIEIHARSENDIMAALALYRPGPLSGGLKDAFVRRFKGEEAVDHLHPSLAPLLNETFGVILYQEQVLRIAHELAGFDLVEADLLRRAMSHFDPGKQMRQLEERFVRGASLKSGVPEETGQRVWEMMAAFSGYGFPKAHAASYAKIAWRSAWCKTYFPAEFMAAVLANWGGYYSQRVYLSEARRMGLIMRPPHVNYASRHFAVWNFAPDKQEKVLFMGLDQIKDLTQRTIEKTIHYRPFHSLEDYLTRVNPRLPEAESLAKVGAFNGMGIIPDILHRLQCGGWSEGQMNLFAREEAHAPDWTLEEKVAAQEKILGVSLEAHPLELLADKILAAGAITTLEAAGQMGKRVVVAGLRQSSHRSKTAKGEPMMFLSLEDLSGVLDVVLFPNVYRQAKSALNGPGPYLLTGIMDRDADQGEPFLRAENLTCL